MEEFLSLWGLWKFGVSGPRVCGQNHWINEYPWILNSVLKKSPIWSSASIPLFCMKINDDMKIQHEHIFAFQGIDLDMSTKKYLSIINWTCIYLNLWWDLTKDLKLLCIPFFGLRIFVTKRQVLEPQIAKGPSYPPQTLHTGRLTWNTSIFRGDLLVLGRVVSGFLLTAPFFDSFDAFNPFEIYWSNWMISLGRGENTKESKPPPRSRWNSKIEVWFRWLFRISIGWFVGEPAVKEFRGAPFLLEVPSLSTKM